MGVAFASVVFTRRGWGGNEGVVEYEVGVVVVAAVGAVDVMEVKGEESWLQGCW